MPPDGVIVLPPEANPQRELPQSLNRSGGVVLPFVPSVDDIPDFDPDSEISLDIGGVQLSISEDGEISAPSIRKSRDPDAGFRDNLAHDVDDGLLNQIAEEIYQGVEADEQSRTPWLEQVTKGFDLLGTKIEDPPSGSSRRNISRANDTTLMEALVKYWANAEAEMLPAAGPAKVMTIGQSEPDEELRAKAFEDDFNYFLTEVASEYYPDTARMLMHQGYYGMGYKKVYRCPMRRRPTSESVLATDLIVSEEATDLASAIRVTHRIEMSNPILRRMMAVGHYRDIELGQAQPGFGIADGVRRAVAQLDGTLMSGFSGRPQDTPHEIWETDAFLDPDYDLALSRWERNAPDGMPLPYKVAIDRSSRRVLGIWRNWRPDDDLFMKVNRFVRFGLIPSLGYSDWGFMQLLGNQTRTLRALLRLLIDAGFFSNFPAGIKAKNARSATNELAPGPGEFVDLDIPANTDISKYVMPFPFKEPSGTLIQLMEIVKQDAMRLGGAAQIEVGEGRSNVPVGTVLAMVEQQVQVMAGIHKGNHRAQRQELRALREVIAEDPASFSLMVRERPCDPAYPRRVWETAQEFTDLNLVPASDPNIPSYIHKLLVANVLMMIAQQAPSDMDMQAVLRNAVATLGVDPSSYVLRPDQKPQPGPPPQDPRVTAKIIDSQTKQAESVTQAQTAEQKMALDRERLSLDAAKAAAQNETMRTVEQTKQQGEIAKIHHDAAVNPPTGGFVG